MNDSPPKLSTKQTSYKPIRIFALIVAILFSVYLLVMLFLAIHQDFLETFCIIVGGLIAVPLSMCWWFALRGEHAKSRARMMYTLLGALIVGGIGFTAGFIGPIIFSPQINDGPLLGIFFTGPLGFVAGAIIGAIVGYIRTRKIPD